MRSTAAIIAVFILMFSCKKEKDKILVFSKTTGYRHESIGDGKLALIELGKRNVSLINIHALAKALGVSPDKLLKTE